MKTKLMTAILFLTFSNISAQTISHQEKQAIFTKSKQEFSKTYHFKEKIPPTVEHLDKQWASGRYNSINKRTEFTDSLASDFRHLTRDGHLNFFLRAKETAKTGESAQNVPWHLLNPRFLNNGLTALEILPGDIGYMRIQAFGSLDDLLPSAFTFVANTQALIIDLRGNGGGMLSNSVSSYLLPADSIHLVTITWNERVDTIRTINKLKGPRYLDKPVYLLTDKGTYSSAEEFAYDLQALKRVTIVGESTGGGANPGGTVPVYTFADGTRIDFFIPTGRVQNAITKTNWEGKGVIPEVKTSSAEALHKAQSLALKSIHQSAKDPFIKKQYLEILSKHEKETPR